VINIPSCFALIPSKTSLLTLLFCESHLIGSFVSGSSAYPSSLILFRKCSKIILFSSPRKFLKNLEKFQEYFNDRELVICREITKLHEEFIRLKVSDLEKIDLNIKGELTAIFSEKKNSIHPQFDNLENSNDTFLSNHAN